MNYYHVKFTFQKVYHGHPSTLSSHWHVTIYLRVGMREYTFPDFNSGQSDYINDRIDITINSWSSSLSGHPSPPSVQWQIHHGPTLELWPPPTQPSFWTNDHFSLKKRKVNPSERNFLIVSLHNSPSYLYLSQSLLPPSCHHIQSVCPPVEMVWPYFLLPSQGPYSRLSSP